MSVLRWILLFLGVAVIAGIYLAGRRKQSVNTVRREPALGHDHKADIQSSESDNDWEQDLVDFDELIADGLQSEARDYKASQTAYTALDEPADEKPAAVKAQSVSSMLLDDELVVLHLMARDGKPFRGPQLYATLSNSGFEWQSNNIFTCEGNEGSYLAINALKPGTFPEQPEQFETRAIGLILRLSQVNAPVAAFDEFLICARYLQEKLDARLCDAQRSSLTIQTVHYLQEEVKAYQLKHHQ